MRIKRSVSATAFSHRFFCSSFALGWFVAVLYSKVIVMVDKVNTYINKMFTGEWEINFCFYYCVLLDPALARNEVFKYWIENRPQIAILLFMDFYLDMKISFLSSWRRSCSTWFQLRQKFVQTWWNLNERILYLEYAQMWLLGSQLLISRVGIGMFVLLLLTGWYC